MTRVTKSTEARRQEIVDTARELFVENGFDKTQVANISAKINVAQGLIYHYFKSKSEILYAVFDLLADEQFELYRKMLKKAHGSALDRLNLIIECKEDLGVYDKLIESIASDPAIIEYCRTKLSTSVTPLLIALIEQGNADGSLHCEYPEETTRFILQGIEGTMPKITDMSDAQRERHIKAHKDIIFRVLGAQA